MNSLQIFKNSEFGEIRTFKEPDGTVLLCGSDVARSLGYTNPQKAINDHCKGVTKRSVGVKTGMKLDGTPALQNVSMNFIPKGDVIRLAASSKLPGAEKFESWIFDEVIPSVLEHGTYMTPEIIEKVLSDPDTIIQLATNLKTEREQRKALEFENAQQKQIIGELQPKVTYYDVVLNNKGLVTVTQISKDYGMTGEEMNELLHSYDVQFKQSGQWLLYSKYHSEGYTHSQTIPIEHKDGTPDVTMHTKWTQKGRLFIYGLLKEHGILPVIERSEKSA